MGNEWTLEPLKIKYKNIVQMVRIQWSSLIVLSLQSFGIHEINNMIQFNSHTHTVSLEQRGFNLFSMTS